jgi:hypothetical protein
MDTTVAAASVVAVMDGGKRLNNVEGRPSWPPFYFVGVLSVGGR